ncbi:MAG: hypothetical protein BWK76_20560 [Desulfobulbaceae bacterium A2]|nr:MAG: hypothetical protein BWK76_20560 [Desulfobulbaceae bacterium A2]
MNSIRLTRADILRVLESIVQAGLKEWTTPPDPLPPDLPLDRLPSPPDRRQLAALAAAALTFFAADSPATVDELVADPVPDHWATRLYQHWQTDDSTIVFSTSGSTGIPKQVRMLYRYLVEDAIILGDLFPDLRRVVAMVPPHHIYGFIFTVLIPNHAGLACTDQRGKPPRQIFRELCSGDLLVSTPLFWKMFAEINDRFPAAVSGVSSTAPCPRETIQRLYTMNIQTLYEVYGSSESSCIGFRNDPTAALRLSPAWTRRPDETFVRTLADGSFSPPFVFQDQLQWRDEHHFDVVRRLDHAVQVGGINVFPTRVAEVLRTHPAVADCAVRLMRPEEGDRLKAFVVPRAGMPVPEGLEEVLLSYLEARLSALELPRRITFGASLPRNAIGKAADWSEPRPPSAPEASA